MVDAPEKIWANGLGCYGTTGTDGTEYTRSDLVAELEAENERLKQEVENWKTSAAGWQKIANVDAEALSRTGAVKVGDIDRRAKEAADAIGVTPYSDMRLFVEQAVKYALSALEPPAPEGFCYRDENGQPQVQRMNETCKCDPIFHEYHDDGVKHCRSCDAEWHPQSDQPVTAAPEGQQEAARIGDAVLAWMTKYDLLDGEQEYYVADVIAVLDGLTLPARPAETSSTSGEQAVTDEMAEAASREYMRIFGKHLLIKHARLILKAAMETGRHD